MVAGRPMSLRSSSSPFDRETAARSFWHPALELVLHSLALVLQLLLDAFDLLHLRYLTLVDKVPALYMGLLWLHLTLQDWLTLGLVALRVLPLTFVFLDVHC